MTKTTRRALLLASLGAGQLALLDRFGLNPLAPARARAASPGPTKLLTIHVPGGWMPAYLWCPLTADEISSVLPAPMMPLGVPAYFRPEWVKNLDGSGDAGAGEKIQRLRVPRMWDETSLSVGQADAAVPLPGASDVTSTSDGWAWVHHELWNDC